MRLIDNLAAALKPPTARPPRYAILSHTWGEDELSYGEVRPGFVRITPSSPRPGWDKVMMARKMALDHGYDYLWVDTCCIDKTNSTELSEAINSMFKWYAEAEVCYVYLSDVPDDDHIRHRHSQFRRSRWFDRGWTLQELLAPKEVHFYSKGWKFLGTKAELGDVVEEITGIPSDVLVSGDCRAPARSIAEIFSWASRRETTLEEDLAYSLLGLLDINMTLIYGEGSKAFIRVQEELLRTYDDETIFAWEAPPNQAFSQPTSGLLSPTLAYFEASHRFLKPRIWTRLDTSPLTITSQGIGVDLPLLPDDSTSGQYLALLNCRIAGSDESEVQPAIRVQSLGGRRYARVDVHHIIPVRFATVLPKTQTLPTTCSLVFPRNPTAPLCATAFVICPDQALAGNLWTTTPITQLFPVTLAMHVAVSCPGARWTELWDKGLVIDSPLHHAPSLTRRRSTRNLLAQRVEGPNDSVTLSLVGGLKVDFHRDRQLFGSANILVGHETTRDAAVPGAPRRSQPWVCILPVTPDESGNGSALQRLPPGARSQWPTVLPIPLPCPLRDAQGVKSHLVVVAAVLERQGPGRVMYEINMSRSYLTNIAPPAVPENPIATAAAGVLAKATKSKENLAYSIRFKDKTGLMKSAAGDAA